MFLTKTDIIQYRHGIFWRKPLGKKIIKLTFRNLLILITINTVRNKKDIAHAFNTFFANIGYNVTHSVPQSNKSVTSYFPNHNAKSIFLDPVILADIFDITNKFKPKTSYGADGISTKLLINTIDTIILPITHIVNLTFETGIFPTDLKCAKIIPIYKVGNPSSLNN